MKNFNDWLDSREQNEAFGQHMNKKIHVVGITKDGTSLIFRPDMGFSADFGYKPSNKTLGTTSPVIDIVATRQQDDKIPQNKLYIAKTENSTYTVSMDDLVAKKVLSTFFARKNQQTQNQQSFSRPTPRLSPWLK